MGEILIPRRTKVEKGYELLADITVGTATTSVDITGLNIGKGDEVVLVSEVFGVTSPPGYDVYLYINGNITKANYYRQLIYATGTSVASQRVNESTMLGIAITDYKSMAISKIKLTNSGYFIHQSSETRSYNAPTQIMLLENYNTSTFVSSAITSLTITASITNGIGIGSRFQLYKIGGA